MIGRNGLSGAQDQRGQEGAELASAQLDGVPPIVEDLECSQHPEFHVATLVRRPGAQGRISDGSGHRRRVSHSLQQKGPPMNHNEALFQLALHNQRPSKRSPGADIRHHRAERWLAESMWRWR